jgi:hypothetical protein
MVGTCLHPQSVQRSSCMRGQSFRCSSVLPRIHALQLMGEAGKVGPSLYCAVPVRKFARGIQVPLHISLIRLSSSVWVLACCCMARYVMSSVFGRWWMLMEPRGAHDKAQRVISSARYTSWLPHDAMCGTEPCIVSAMCWA